MGAFFVDFEALEAVFGFVVLVASCTIQAKVKCATAEGNQWRTLFVVVFAVEFFFFDAAGAVFFWGALLAAAGFVAAAGLIIFFLSPVVATDALTLGLAMVFACRV